MDQARINARCLVLLHEKLDTAATKILHGMLNVLNLPDKEIIQMTLLAKNLDIYELEIEIQDWKAEYILQLNMEMPGCDRKNWIQTYSPAYLQRNPQFKAQAYKSLLALRAMLHGSSSFNS